MCVTVLSIAYTFFVYTSISKISVFLIVILSGLSGVISYFFQGKLKIFLSAEGKGYIVTNITTLTTVGVSLSKAGVLVLGGNVVLVQTVYFVFNLLQMLLIVFYIKKNYPWLDIKEEPDYGAISQKKAVLVHQIAELIFNNTDTIILTVFTTLKTVSVYSMYAMIFGMVKSVSVTFSDGFLHALGQSYTNKEKFEKMHNAYEVYNMAITFAIFCIAGILIIPFLKLYTDGINDINYADYYVAGLFVMFYLLANGRKSCQVVINIAQHFEKTKWRSVVEAIINLSLSIILTMKFGIYGVLLGTIGALLYRTNDVIIYASRLMERSPLITYKRWVRNFIVFIFVFYINSKLDMKLDSYFNLVVYGIVLSATVIPAFVGINSIFEVKTAKYVFGAIRTRIRKKRH